MSLADLGNLGEFIGSVAVLISLIYVGFQIRSNTRAVRASTFLGLTNGWVEYVHLMAQPEVAALLERARREPDRLDPVELSRVWAFGRGTFRRFENDYFQFRSGTFDAGAWLGYQNSLRNEILSAPHMRAMWALTRDVFSPEFAALVDREAEAARAAQRNLDDSDSEHHFTNRWKEALRRERGQPDTPDSED